MNYYNSPNDMCNGVNLNGLYFGINGSNMNRDGSLCFIHNAERFYLFLCSSERLGAGYKRASWRFLPTYF